MWPRVADGLIRVVFSHTSAYDAAAEAEMNKKLKFTWVASNDDTSHSSLKSSGGRDFASNGWALQRKDFAA